VIAHQAGEGTRVPLFKGKFILYKVEDSQR
jgi:hypothetical protein